MTLWSRWELSDELCTFILAHPYLHIHLNTCLQSTTASSYRLGDLSAKIFRTHLHKHKNSSSFARFRQFLNCLKAHTNLVAYGQPLARDRTRSSFDLHTHRGSIPQTLHRRSHNTYSMWYPQKSQWCWRDWFQSSLPHPSPTIPTKPTNLPDAVLPTLPANEQLTQN